VLPALSQTGDLPAGIHEADWKEIEQRFGSGADSRVRAFARVRHGYELADRTGFLRRSLIFGSFVSAAAELRDIDIVLIMENAAVRGEGSAFGSQNVRIRPAWASTSAAAPPIAKLLL